MNIVVDAPPDPARWRAAFRHVMKKPARRVRILGAVLVLSGLFMLLVGGGEFVRVVIAATLIVVGLIYAVLAPALAVSRSLRRMPMALNQPQRIELTDSSVRVGSPLITTEYAWAAVDRADLVPGYLLLMFGRYQVMPVPLDGLTPAEQAELAEFTANLNYVRQ